MTEINIYFDFLLSVLKADGQVKQEERDFIIVSAKALGVSVDEIMELNQKIDGKEIDLPKVLAAVKNKSDPSFTINLLRDGYSIAKSDGAVADAELAILKNLIQLFDNYSEDTFNELLDWCDESLYLKNVGNELILKVMEV
jgi:uncharacterized tellurite resistance protein B-like protein